MKQQNIDRAIVNAGCLLFLDAQLATSLQNDVLNSLLYIQLAAHKKHSRFTEFESWEGVWRAAALRFGWVLNSSEFSSEPVGRSGTDTVWGICARAMGAAVGKVNIADAERLLSLHPQHDALTLLRSQALQVCVEECKPARATLTLQVGFVDAHARLALALIHFTSYQPLTSGLLFEPLDAAHVLGNLDVTVYSMGLLDHAYRQYRDAFDAALVDRRPSLVRSLDGHP